MKKKINKPMRAAGILLVATMLTTCMTAGTFAKYTTSDSATDTARVAKFGVNVSVNGSLFGEEYVEANGNTPDVWTGHYVQDDDTTNVGTVQVFAQGENVVAPGTKNNTGLGLKIQGQPEVDCEVSIDFEAKNIYLAKGNYAVMETVTFANKDEFKQAVNNGNIYLYNNGTWTLIPTNTAADDYGAGNTYCKLKNVVDEDDFVGNYYFPVVYNAHHAVTPTIPAGDFTSTSAADSLKVITQSLAGLADADKSVPATNVARIGYSKTSFTTYTQQANNAFDADFPAMTLTWEWAFEVNDATNKLDTILGDLVAQDQANYGTLNDSTTPFVTAIATEGACRVVKTTNNGNSYAVPTAASSSAADDTHKIKYLTNDADYNLETAVYFSATVTQVD